MPTSPNESTPSPIPGLTANFDAGKTAALAITMLDWLDGGPPTRPR